MDAAQALADLTEISSQIEAAVLFRADGEVVAATGGDGPALAASARDLLAAADAVRPGETPIQVEVATREGSVFVVREGECLIAATTSAEPTVGLVFYDLKGCLRSAAEAPAPKKRTRRTKETDGAA